jgi:hypothetical protein
MSLYTEFVKTHYSEVKHLEPKMRFKKLAEMWASHKKGEVKGGVMTAAGLKMKPAKKMQGKGLVSEALGLLGL